MIIALGRPVNVGETLIPFSKLRKIILLLCVKERKKSKVLIVFLCNRCKELCYHVLLHGSGYQRDEGKKHLLRGDVNCLKPTIY